MIDQLATQYHLDKNVIKDAIKELIHSKKMSELKAIFETKSIIELEEIIKEQTPISILEVKDEETVIVKKKKPYGHR